jgi:serine/threonine-protein kinase
MWTEQIKQIETFENQEQFSNAVLAASRLVQNLKRLNSGNELLPVVLDRKGHIEEDLGQYREAERDYWDAVGIWRSARDAPSPGLATELNNLASLLSATGRVKRAEALRRESLTLRLRFMGPRHPEVALSYSNLAVDLFRERRYAEASGFCREALAIWSSSSPDLDRSDLALHTLALIELHDHNPSAAVTFALAALCHRRSHKDADMSSLASYEHTVALAQEGIGQLDDAEQDFRSALARVGGPGQNTPSLVRIGLLTDYAHLLNTLKRKKEAKQLLREAEFETTTLARANEWQHTVELNALLPKNVTGSSR